MEVLTGVVLADLYNFDISMIDIVKRSQQAENEFVEEFIKNVGEEYKNKIGYQAEFYVAQIGDGARRL